MRKRDKLIEKFNGKRVLLLPYFSVLIVLIITIGVTFLFYNNATSKDGIRFENETTKINARLENELTKQVTALKSTQNIIKSSEEIPNEKENAIFESKSIGFLKYTEPNKTLPENFSKIDFNNFEFSNITQNNFQLESIDKESAIKSIANDEPFITEIEFKESIVDSNEGYLLLLPVFENITKSDKTTNSFIGFVFYPFNKQILLNSVYDTSSINEVGLQLSLNDNKFIKQDVIKSSLGLEKDFNTLGLKWKAEYLALSTFFDKSSVYLTGLIPLGGFLLGILLFGFFRYEAISKIELAEIAEELSNAQSKNATLLKSEQEARKEAEISNRIKDEFISMVSHEIRTPLNSISGWTSILRGENLTQETKQRALKTIKKNIKTQSNIIDELLLFSNLSSEDQIIKKDLAKISGIVESALEEVLLAAKQKEIHIVKENGLNGENIYCDKKKIHKAIHNLLQNAIKFTPNGGEIKLIAGKDENNINLKISDSGKGIKKEVLPHIFDKFRQADSSTTRNFGGLGLGLTISNQIIKLHGGKINVTSEGEDKGTEFEIILPKNT